MLRLTPILLAVAAALVMYHFSAWRTGRELTNRSHALRDPVLLAMTRRLAEVLNLPALKVHVYDIDPVNGLAAPDGRIFITRGFLKKYEAGEVSAEELTSVIAHELGHVALGHSKRRMIDFSGQNAIRVILTMVLGRFVPVAGAYLANLLAGMLAARLSRQDEYEADAYAAALMSKAGFGIGPQVSLFEKLDRLSGPKTQLAWLMSHPATPERIAAIKRLDKGWSS